MSNSGEINKWPSGFDPWSATPAEAIEALSHATGVDDPLAQQQAAARITAMRGRCLAPGGGCAVLLALRLCAEAGLAAPGWLAAEFVRRHALVTDAHLPSWDDSFGRPWPPYTRLAEVRRRREELQAVHAAVWQRVMAGEPVDEWLFEQVAEELRLGLRASSIRDRYYQALNAGMPNAAQVRATINSEKSPELLERLPPESPAPSLQLSAKGPT